MERPRQLRPGLPYGPTRSEGDQIWDAFRAAAAGDAGQLTEALVRDPRLVRAEIHYVQPLEIAVREGRKAAVRVLLAAGADPARVSLDGADLAHTARERGHHDVAGLLEAERARLRRTAAGPRETPLHRAAAAGDLPALTAALLDTPGWLEAPDPAGARPLHRAAAAGQRRAIDLLLERGADLNARHAPGPGTPGGYAPVDFEAVDLALWASPWWQIRGDLRTARHLVERGVRLDPCLAAALDDGEALRAQLAGRSEGVDEPRPHGKRALSTAVQFERRALVELLLEAGADPNAPEGAIAPRGSALHHASSRGDKHLVELLLVHGADPNAEIDASGSATFAAADPATRRLLERAGGRLSPYDRVWLGDTAGAIAQVRDAPATADEGCGTVLAAACAREAPDLVQELLAAGAELPTRLTGCRSYLWSDPACLRVLLGAGLDPDLPDWQNATPLHDLCGRDARGRPRPARLACAELLRAAGAALEAVDEAYRSTPLGWAARNDLPDMVDWLLDHGADPDAPTEPAWARPLAWARSRGHEAVARRLERAGARG